MTMRHCDIIGTCECGGDLFYPLPPYGGDGAIMCTKCWEIWRPDAGEAEGLTMQNTCE